MLRKTMFAGAVALAAISTVAVAAVTFDSASGTGFVGKGDVQLALGLNNAQVQNTPVNFTYSSTSVSEVSWDCTNANNEHVQQRSRTTTTSTQGVVSSVARVKNQITGYNLTGWSGTVSNTSDTDGPALNSCPANPSTFYLSSPAGDPVVTVLGGGLSVNGVPIQ